MNPGRGTMGRSYSISLGKYYDIAFSYNLSGEIQFFTSL